MQASARYVRVEDGHSLSPFFPCVYDWVGDIWVQTSDGGKWLFWSEMSLLCQVAKNVNSCIRCESIASNIND